MFYAYGVSTRSLRAELQLCDQSTLIWKEFLAATMDKNLTLREDKVRLAFDHFRRRWIIMEEVNLARLLPNQNNLIIWQSKI
mmetsp:Transcript_16050/g.22359  ORF Transcript_16050/g.22359 Transcript_16050/m.22359 type:complete len:82 (+) Transcript_16050:1007-1252(+)